MHREPGKSSTMTHCDAVFHSHDKDTCIAWDSNRRAAEKFLLNGSAFTLDRGATPHNAVWVVPISVLLVNIMVVHNIFEYGKQR